MFGIGYWELVIIGLICAGPTLAGVIGLLVVVISRRNLRISANLTNCPDCGHYVSRRAAACTQCGRPL